MAGGSCVRTCSISSSSSSVKSLTISWLQRLVEIALLVEHISDAAGHAGREVAARWPENDDAAARHVFAAVIADGFDDGIDAAVADAEPLAGHAADIRFAAGGAVKGDVADDDVFLRERTSSRPGG